VVINLVCEDSIEHGMVHLLGAKQALADGVLDGQGDLAALKMPSGRGAMIERMQALMQAVETVVPSTMQPEVALAAELQRRHGERALLVEARQGGDGRVRLLAVLDLDRDVLKAEAKRFMSVEGSGPAVEVIDRATWLAVRRLQSSGFVQLVDGPSRILHRAPELAVAERSIGEANAAKARAVALRGQARRALRMARVLADGGFPEEALPLLGKAIRHGGAARLVEMAELDADVTMATPTQIRELVDRKALPLQAIATLNVMAEAAGAPSGAEVDRLLEATAEAMAACIEGTEVMDAEYKA
jgi:hypothetical protein